MALHKPVMASEVREMRRLRGSGLSGKQIAKQVGRALSTVQRLLGPDPLRTAGQRIAAANAGATVRLITRRP